MKYFTYIENITPKYGEIIEANKLLLGDDFIIFTECLNLTDYEGLLHEGQDIRWKSDLARVLWLMANPTWIWIDADSLVLKPIDFQIEKPMFYQFRGDLDICVIAGNGTNDIFKDMLTLINNDVGWAQAWINSHRDQCEAIPKGYFEHKALHNLR